MFSYKEVLGLIKQSGYINGKYVPDRPARGSYVNGKPVTPSVTKPAPAAPVKRAPAASPVSSLTAVPQPEPTSLQSQAQAERAQQNTPMNRAWDKVRYAAGQAAYQVNDAYRKSKDAINNGIAGAVSAVQNIHSPQAPVAGVPTGILPQGYQRSVYRRPSNRQVPRFNATSGRYY